MDPHEFLRVFEEVLPAGSRPQAKGDWIHICDKLGLPTNVGVSDMIESVYTERGMMLYAHRTGEFPEKIH